MMEVFSLGEKKRKDWCFFFFLIVCLLRMKECAFDVFVHEFCHNLQREFQK